MMISKKIQILSVMALLSLGAASCESSTPKDTSNSIAVSGVDDLVPIKFATWDGKGSESIKPTIGPAKSSVNLLMALSACECAEAMTGRIFTQNAMTKGVLPQVLVPKIREKIATDSSLAILSQLPPGLNGLMKSLFANEDKIYSSVRDGIQDSLNQSLASMGGTSLSRRIPFRLDLFTSSVYTPSGYPVTFEISEQAARWNHVMSVPAMWKQTQPVDGYDHGVQLLETMRVAAEWAYLSGIGATGEPDGYGGLASNVIDGPSKMSRPQNPETASDSWAIFASGKFSIAYPYASSVDMATRIREKWSSAPNTVSLEEQAMIWRAAALAFSKMRPDRLGRASAIFSAPGGALGFSTAKLPLVWLPALGVLLEQKFINVQAQTIQEYAYPTAGKNQNAKLKSLLIAAQAIQEWRLATTDINKAGFPEEIRKRLLTVPKDLELPLQFIARSILNSHTTMREDNFGISVTANKDDGSVESDPAVVAQMVATLGWLEQVALTGPTLKDRVLSLYQWHVRKNLVATNNAGVMDAESVLWNLRAAEVMSNYKDAPPWITKLRDNLRTVVANWR